jgi:hypothetical protein
MSLECHFKILVRGCGLVRVVDGAACPVGLYTSVFVLADGQMLAKKVALDLLRARLAEKGAMTERTSFDIESIEEITAEQVPLIQPGFAFYRE